ncbi:hypothetical protein FGO68_gene17014 [Halteria grandinella]|uniref:Uncharacterized protein n=1 Tax=Halteria grandinella TaxID=5974 RepID=A0A8J8SWM0_HALGN|nr:hypothetical protein FGO68_gene17014 [Halteria grandinella]
MWKIRQKYLFIELMTYLAFRHTQSLLFRVSKDFRSRLISSFKQLKNMLGQNDYEAPKVCSIKLGYILAKPEKIYIEQDQLKVFQQNLTIMKLVTTRVCGQTICILQTIKIVQILRGFPASKLQKDFILNLIAILK